MTLHMQQKKVQKGITTKLLMDLLVQIAGFLTEGAGFFDQGVTP